MAAAFFRALSSNLENYLDRFVRSSQLFLHFSQRPRVAQVGTEKHHVTNQQNS